MESALPEDLAQVREWAETAIKLARELYSGGGRRKSKNPRMELIRLLLAPPPVSQGLHRELVIASNPRPRQKPRCYVGISAAHPLNAIKELCWRVVEEAHRQNLIPIDLRVFALRSSTAPADQKLARRLRRAREAIEAATKHREDLERLLPKINVGVRLYNLGAGPTLPGDAPLGDLPARCAELLLILDATIQRVWDRRLRREEARRQPQSAAAAVLAAAAAPKARRGRRPQANPADDQRLAAAWQNSGLRSYDEFARELGGGVTATQIRRAVDRHRHRAP